MNGTLGFATFIFDTLGKIVGYLSPITGTQLPLPVPGQGVVPAAVASASPTNLTAANILTWGAKISGAQGSGFNVQLPTAALIIAALSAAVPLDGTFTINLRITNVDTTQLATVLTAAGITLSGTMTIATGTARDFDLVVTSPTTITITNAGATTL